jgi:hypothetical protein
MHQRRQLPLVTALAVLHGQPVKYVSLKALVSLPCWLEPRFDSSLRRAARVAVNLNEKTFSC